MNRPALFAAVGLIVALAAAPFAVEARGPFSNAPAEVKAGLYRFDPGHTKITWSISHLGFSTYAGQFSGVSGAVTLDPAKVGSTALDVTVDTTSLGTLNPALDTHLKSPDFLDVAAFPKAEFHATGVKLSGERTALITGDLTLHGVTRPVTIEATFNQAGVNPLDRTYSLGFDGKAVIKRSEFGINAYLPALGDEVTLTIEAELKLVS